MFLLHIHIYIYKHNRTNLNGSLNGRGSDPTEQKCCARADCNLIIFDWSLILRCITGTPQRHLGHAVTESFNYSGVMSRKSEDDYARHRREDCGALLVTEHKRSAMIGHKFVEFYNARSNNRLFSWISKAHWFFRRPVQNIIGPWTTPFPAYHSYVGSRNLF